VEPSQSREEVGLPLQPRSWSQRLTAVSPLAVCWLNRFAQSSDEASLRRASRLDPGNAEYQHMLGLHQLALQAPKEAIGPLNRARF
jgi:hypothetical protein